MDKSEQSKLGILLIILRGEKKWGKIGATEKREKEHKKGKVMGVDIFLSISNKLFCKCGNCAKKIRVKLFFVSEIYYIYIIYIYLFLAFIFVVGSPVRTEGVDTTPKRSLRSFMRSYVSKPQPEAGQTCHHGNLI